MKAPSLADRRVKVTAYLTDEAFGYDHWRAAQFSAPQVPDKRPALLLVFDTEEERDDAALLLKGEDGLLRLIVRMLAILLQVHVVNNNRAGDFEWKRANEAVREADELELE